MLGQEGGGASEMYLESHRPSTRKRHTTCLQQKETCGKIIFKVCEGIPGSCWYTRIKKNGKTTLALISRKLRSLTLRIMLGSLHLASFPAKSWTPKLAKTSISVNNRIET